LGAAIGATNSDPSRIGYIAGTVIGPGTATYSIQGGSVLTGSAPMNHYTPVYGSTGGNSGSASVGISNAGEQAHNHSVTSNVTISNVQNTAADAVSAHSNMQPTMVLNYIIKAL
jgi:microcystin-dependent protein